jgi:type IV secretion system protein TrbG
MCARKFLLMVVLGLPLAACAHNAPPPSITYDNAEFKPAVEKHDPAPRPAPAIPVGTVIGPPAPLPDANEKDAASPTARVETANRAALHEPARDDYINAAQIYPFSDNALYRLYTAPEQVSDIALQPGETPSAISAGDTVRWAVGDTASGNGAERQVHVLVKPFTAGLKTNLVILTDRRTYHLELVSTKSVSMAAVSWNYPNDQLISEKDGQTDPVASRPIDAGIAIDNIHFRYAITGDDPPWRPVRAFDDGNKVYIEFPKRIDQGDAPPLFVIGADGGTELVNYRMRGNYYVVDRLFAAAELRLGEDKQQIVRITRTDGKSQNAASIFGE